MFKRLLVLIFTVALGVAPACDSNNGGGTSPTTLSPDSALKAAAIVASCLPDDDTRRIISRFYLDVKPDTFFTTAALQCVAARASEGCGAVETCLGAKVELSAFECDSACDGTVLTACDGNLKFSVDCAKNGRVCVDSGDGADCRPTADGVPCDYDTFTPRCEDGAPVYCADGFEAKGPVCADHGTECRVVGDAGALCVGPGAACEAGILSPSRISFRGGLRCDGGVLTACVNGGEATLDCTTLGTDIGCHTRGDAAFCGLADECVPTGDEAGDSQCNGDALTVCNLGRNDTVDCTTLGFDGCNATYGICNPPFAP